MYPEFGVPVRSSEKGPVRTLVRSSGSEKGPDPTLVQQVRRKDQTYPGSSGAEFGERNGPNPDSAGSEFREKTGPNAGSAGSEFGERNG